jgi:hypothetical protein
MKILSFVVSFASLLIILALSRVPSILDPNNRRTNIDWYEILIRVISEILVAANIAVVFSSSGSSIISAKK